MTDARIQEGNMEVFNYPRLCGGTFFTLLLECQKQIETVYASDKNSFTEPEMLIGLQYVIAPDFIAPSFPKRIKAQVTKFKSCSSHDYSMFRDCPETTEFSNRVKNNYAACLCDMASFVDRYIAVGTSGRRDYRLVAALIDLVLKDESIPSNTGFYINPDGTAVQKSNFNELTDICITSFLLGILHFVLTERLDNNIGEMTYNAWCPPQNGAPRLYKGNMGETVLPRLSKVYPYIKEENSNSNSNVNVIIDSQTVSTPKERITKYLSYIEKACARYNVMKLIGGDEVPLEDFFVCNTIGEKERVFADKKRIKIAYLDNPDLNTIRNVYSKRGYDNLKMILIGSGGCGKSLMLQHLFLKSASEYINTSILPVFLELRYFTDKDSLLSFIVETVSSKDSEFTENEAHKLLHDGRIQLLLDGFDEIDPSDIKSFLRKLEQFCDKYNKVQIVMSSRETENIAGLRGFMKWYVWPFDNDQSEKLIDKILTYQNEMEEKQNVIDFISKGFLQKDGVFASHPLLLTYVAMRYPEYRRFNEDHKLFYKVTYEALLSGHDDNKKPYDRVFMSVDNAEQFSTVFKEFCAITYRDAAFQFDSTSFEAYFKMLKSHLDFKNPYKMNVKNFKHDVCSTACMMYEKEYDIYYIDHGFQEFLFAEYYAKADIKETEELVSFLMRFPYDRVYSFDALDMLYDFAPQKFRMHVLFPFLKKIFIEDDLKSFIMLLEKCFESVQISVHNEVMESHWMQKIGAESILRRSIDNYPSTILLNYALKIIDGRTSFSLFSKSLFTAEDECEETGRFIGEVGDVKDKKVLLIDCMPLNAFNVIYEEEKNKQDPDWLVNDNKELLIFGYRLTLDTCYLSKNIAKYGSWLKELMVNSQETYLTFRKLKKLYASLKKEKRRSEM